MWAKFHVFMKMSRIQNVWRDLVRLDKMQEKDADRINK